MQSFLSLSQHSFGDTFLTASPYNIHDFDGCSPAVPHARQVPWEYGQLSAPIYEHFILPMHQDNRALVAAFKGLAAACTPVLKRGCNPGRLVAVQDALSTVEDCRRVSSRAVFFSSSLLRFGCRHPKMKGSLGSEVSCLGSELKHAGRAAHTVSLGRAEGMCQVYGAGSQLEGGLQACIEQLHMVLVFRGAFMRPIPSVSNCVLWVGITSNQEKEVDGGRELENVYFRGEITG